MAITSKPRKMAQALQRQTLSYEQAGSSVLKIMEYLRNSKKSYYRRKKQSYIYFLITVSAKVRKVWKGKNKTPITFSPLHIVNKSMGFDPNVNNSQNLISA